jgi:hypothetical protein
MIEIARVTLTSTASPRQFFERWCDLPTHPEWAVSMESFRLDEPFAVGARGTLKVRGGHEAPFVVTECVPDRSYADTTILDGAELTVHHEAVPVGGEGAESGGDAGSHVTLRAWLTGDRAPELAALMRDEVQTSLDRDLRALARLLESGVSRVQS